MTDFDLRVISLGAGVQSTTMYRMAAVGELTPMPDAAIFADTQQEPPWVYENLERLKADHGGRIPIMVRTAGDLGEAVEKCANSSGGRFASVPFWVDGDKGASPARRHCTREYKIAVVHRAVRELLGLEPRQRAAGRFRVEEWVGISLDEAHRAKPSRYAWITTRWPLLFGRPMRREGCKTWLAEHGYSIPEKSACVFCPYRRPVEYARWREEHPELFEEACRVDDLIRPKGTMKGMRAKQYIYRGLVPLRELPPLADLEARDDSQLDLFGNECEGMCGV